MVVLGVGTTVYLLLNLSGDKRDNIIQEPKKPASEPADDDDDYDVVLKPGYWWSDSNKKAHIAWFKSAFKGDLKRIKSLLAEEKVDIHATDNDGNTALILSAREGRLPCLKYLHEQGADIDAKNNNGNTAFMVSEFNGRLFCAKYLFQQGAYTRYKNENSNKGLFSHPRYRELFWDSENPPADPLM